MQLRPREFFTIVRGITDTSDALTYYVQAVIRNAKTDELIETVNLIDKGNRRFSKPWQVPADVSGEGFYIIITVTVYTDAGYTTKSTDYPEVFDTYLVQERINPNLGIGGGADIDYKKIEKMVAGIIKEEIKGLPSPEKPDEVDLSSVSSLIEKAISKIDGIVIPEQKQIDLKPVLSLVSEAISQIKAINIPEPEKLDLEPVLEKIDGLSRENIEKKLADILDRIRQYFDGDMAKLEGFFTEITSRLDNTPMLIAYDKPGNTLKKPAEVKKGFGSNLLP